MKNYPLWSWHANVYLYTKKQIYMFYSSTLQQDRTVSCKCLCLLLSSDSQQIDRDRCSSCFPPCQLVLVSCHHRPKIVRERSNVLQQQVLNHSLPTKLRKTVKYLWRSASIAEATCSLESGHSSLTPMM